MSAALSGTTAAKKPKAPVKAVAAAETGAADTEKMPAVDEAVNTLYANRLIMLGARIAVVSHMTSLPRKRLRRLYKEWTGNDPHPGHLPSNPSFYTEDLMKSLHSSVFLSFYRYHASLVANDVASPQLLITVYEAYLSHFGVKKNLAVLDFNRAWALIRAYRAGQVLSQRCRCCRSNYVVTTGFSRQGCPICSIYSKNKCADCNTWIRTGSDLLQTRGKRRCTKCQRLARNRQITLAQLASSPHAAIFA